MTSFGSKTQMLRALARYGAPDVRAAAGRVTAGHASPLERVREYALCWADLAGTPKAYLNSLQAFIEIDLGDPVMYKSTLAAARETETVMTELGSDAISAGSIQGSDARATARVILAAATARSCHGQRVEKERPRAGSRVTSMSSWTCCAQTDLVADATATRDGVAGNPQLNGGLPGTGSPSRTTCRADRRRSDVHDGAARATSHYRSQTMRA
jgi:AcrR family transcriptional regulator